MSDAFLINFLSFTYPYLVILFWILAIAAIAWGGLLLIKRGRKSDK